MRRVVLTSATFLTMAHLQLGYATALMQLRLSIWARGKASRGLSEERIAT